MLAHETDGIHVLVIGRVQGVGFRNFVLQRAEATGVTGWVRNLADGRVEAFVEGESEAVTRVERSLRTGPRGARVATMTSDDELPQGRVLSFEIVP